MQHANDLDTERKTMRLQSQCLALLVLANAFAGAPAYAKDPANVQADSKPGITAPRTNQPSPDRPLDLNSALKVELKRLPGIGEREANLIISARPFRTKAELVTRNLISEEQFTKLRKLVVVRNPPMPKVPATTN